MVSETYNFVVAIDAYVSSTPDEDNLVKIPKKLRKMLEKGEDDLGLKILILHNPEWFPTNFFKQSFLSKYSRFVNFWDNQNDFMLKIGLALGQKAHTLIYSSKYEKMELKMKEKLKFIFTADPLEVDIDKESSIGHLLIKPLEELDAITFDILEGIENLHNKECYPERALLEEDSEFNATLNYVWEKIGKQFANHEKTDIWKFMNSCNNLITQHLTSSKNQLINLKLYKEYMLSFVIDELASNELILSDFINLFTKEGIYSSKKLLNLLNVEIDCKELGKTYGGISQKYKEIIDNSQNSTMWSSKGEISKSKIDDFEDTEESKLDESTKVSTNCQRISLTDELMNYIKSWFFKKYEQANFSNIKKTNKFWNAMHHLIKQAFESKKFKKMFPEYDDDEETIERVSL
jgi:hypothetical protein